MIRSVPFFRAYRALPHFAVNRCALALARREGPKWLVESAVRSWIRRDRIDMRDFEAGPYRSLQHFFLRRLAPGARPLDDGFVAPVDGCVVGSGLIEQNAMLQVKGHPISVEALVNGKRQRGRRPFDLALDPYEGGRYLTLFLRPRGYHYVHAPCDLTVEDVRWIPGRFFPQNEDALQNVPRIYERNERAVLRVRTRTMAGERPALLVMVGASVIGGIHVAGLERLRQSAPSRMDRAAGKGAELGHFDFGSTVIVLLPRAARARPLVRMGQEVLMGQRLFAEDLPS